MRLTTREVIKLINEDYAVSFPVTAYEEAIGVDTALRSIDNIQKKGVDSMLTGYNYK